MIRETSKIVSAYLAGNHLAETEISDFIRSTYAALVATAAPEQAAEAVRPQPAVPTKKSIMPDAIVCLECGKKFSMLKRHLRTDHDTSVDEYRMKWGLPLTYPMVAPNYSERRSALAVKIGLGHSRKKDVPTAAGQPHHGQKRSAAE